jgi:hypothetical protein
MTGFVASAALISVGAGLALIAVRLARQRRLSPTERERERRLTVNRNGRILDAEVTGFADGVILYRYAHSGVSYEASQDVSSLRDYLPSDLASIVGPASIKYMVRNPADSILLCEDWSGLRGSSGVHAAGPSNSDATAKKELLTNEKIA